MAKRKPTLDPSDAGRISFALFWAILLSFLAGVVVRMAAPGGDNWDMAAIALFLMALPPLLLCPIGLLLGLAGVIATAGQSRRAAFGLAGHTLVVILWLGWRFI